MMVKSQSSVSHDPSEIILHFLKYKGYLLVTEGSTKKL